MDKFRDEGAPVQKLRKGYTTGSCAAGAAKAAVYMICTGMPLEWVTIDTPDGSQLTLPVTDCRIEAGIARCSIVKDAGDDPDVTDGIKVFAETCLLDRADVVIE
ncbi:MAG TPA: hypothetical protein DDW65_10790, partial [Firmicutes bacterium]|nr:hypothetical protein [Bacillota bacterium]